MKLTAKIRKFKGKKLQTVEEVRAGLITIIQDIKSGGANPKDKAALKTFF